MSAAAPYRIGPEGKGTSNTRKVIRRRSDCPWSSTSVYVLPQDPREDSRASHIGPGPVLNAFQKRNLLISQETIVSSVCEDSAIVAILRGSGALSRLTARMTIALSRENEAVRELIRKGNSRQAIMSIYDSIAPSLSLGSVPIPPQGDAGVILAIMRMDGRYSVARVGAGTAFHCREDGAENILYRPLIVDQQGVSMDLRDMDIADYAENRYLMEKGIDPRGLVPRSMVSCSGSLADEQSLLIGGGGFFRNLWIRFNPIIEAVVDASGNMDISNLIAGAPDPEMLTSRLEAEITVRRGMCGKIHLEGEWALAPTEEDISFAILSKG